MPYLINPSGRIVQIDDQEQYEYYKSQLGFQIPSPEQERAHSVRRLTEIEMMKRKTEENFEKSFYMATVSQGGKDGYGIASGKLINELKALDMGVDLYNKGQKVGLLFHAPYSLLRMENQVRILYTMFESDKLPDDWRDYLEAADLILVPSKWCQGVFKKFGFDAKVVPLGYDDKTFTYKERVNKREARKDFTFLHYNAFNLRKGFLEVLEAFTKAFDKTEPVKMVFKTNRTAMPFPFIQSEYPNIKVINAEYNDIELAELCHQSDAFVFPSRGEGFGITPLEAMATGLPTIVPNAHGISEYFNNDYMYEVNVEKTCPGIYTRYKGQDVGKMVVCSADHLAQQMRYIYEHQDEAMAKGKAAAEYVKQWTFANSARLLKEIIDEYMGRPVVDKPIRNILHLEEVK